MLPGDTPSLRDAMRGAARADERHIFAAGESVALGALIDGTALDCGLAALAGRSVLIATRHQLETALALIELDGVARRLVICPPDVAEKHLAGVIADAGIDTMVTDGKAGAFDGGGIGHHVTCSRIIHPSRVKVPHDLQTEWILFTSGTSGAPKLVLHTLAGLTAAIKRKPDGQAPVIWGTFYDIRRYGGLQIFLRAIVDGGSLILSSASEPVGDHLLRLAAHGVTHLSGTPSHWRRVLMSPSACEISPQYIRLSGEIADQAIIDNLRAFFPSARIGHAYASTEAGVGFEVNDEREGFPASFVGQRGEVEMRVEDGSLRLRSARAALRYLGDRAPVLRNDDGFVDTGDMVELVGERFHFVGRRGGIINVGGLKVHPEEVEAVINRHPRVRMSLVRPRKNPITGALVVADVVLRDNAEHCGALRQDIIARCRDSLAPHKVPAAIEFVPTLDVGIVGKLTRRHA